MPTALITSLITTPDNTEVVRDQIAAILLLESQGQMALALASTPTLLDPTNWQLRVFTERANPWAEFVDSPDSDASTIDRTPIVNVAFDNWSSDMSMGNIVARQQVTASFNVDIYGYGQSASDGVIGHVSGDARAAFEAQRGARLVRQILMSNVYAHLGMRGVVGRRWPMSMTLFQPSTGEHPVQHVCAVRLVLQVSLNEFSPQVDGPLLTLVSASILRADNGQILIAEDFPIGA